MADERLIIKVDLEKGDVTSATKELNKEAQKAGDEAGKRLGKSFSDSTKSSFETISKRATAIIAGIAAARALAGSLRAVTNAAIVQEDAINSLNNALKTSGDFSEQVSSNLQEFASNLQQVTRFGDEAILNQLAIAKSFGATNEQVKLILTAATDLSAALGISLESAVRNVSKTLGGLSGELGESIPQLKELGAEALKSGQGIEFIADRFAGAAQRDVSGYSGSVDQAANAFGDLLEEAGAFITQNDTVLEAVKLSTEAFVSFGRGLKIIREEFLGISQNKADTEIEKINEQLSSLGRELNKNVDLLNEFKASQNGDGSFLDVFNRKTNAQIEKQAEVVKSIREERKKLLKQRADAIAARNKEAANNIENDKKEIESNTQKLSAIQLFGQAQIENSRLIEEQEKVRLSALEQLRERELIGEQEFLLQKELIQQESRLRTQELERQARDQQLVNNQLTKDALIQNLKDIQDATVDSFKNIQVSSNELGKTLSNLGVKGFGTLGRNIGAALAQGKSVNEAFVQSVRATASEAAEAFGEYYIKLGVAKLAATGGADGASTLAGGVALKALAGALGSGGGVSSGGSGGGAGSFNSSGFQEPFQDDNLADPQAVERAEERTNLTLNIEGSLIRESELGGFVADILENSSNDNATVIPSLRTARA